jgi:hypothetical protein
MNPLSLLKPEYLYLLLLISFEHLLSTTTKKSPSASEVKLLIQISLHQ